MSFEHAKGAIWDLPIRLFHWTLAALIAFCWWSAEEEHLDWHLYAGLAVISLIIFRVLWGIFGSSTARFSSFVRGPRAVATYVRNPGSWAGIGHNPIGALSIIAMLAVIAAEAALGLFAVDEDGLFEGPLARLVSIQGSDLARELHESGFNVILALVGLHIAAIVVYRLMGKKLVKAMITGRGEVPAGTPPMRRGKWWVAVLCLVAGIALTRWLLAGAPPFGG